MRRHGRIPGEHPGSRAEIQRAGNGVVKLGSHLRLTGELAVNARRGLFDGVKQAFIGFAAGKGIAAAQKIVG